MGQQVSAKDKDEIVRNNVISLKTLIKEVSNFNSPSYFDHTVPHILSRCIKEVLSTLVQKQNKSCLLYLFPFFFFFFFIK